MVGLSENGDKTMKHIFGFGSGEISFSIEKGQLYHLVRNGQTIARFDTEEKARLYSEGLMKGIEWGYSSGFEKGKIFQFKRINQHIKEEEVAEIPAKYE